MCADGPGSLAAAARPADVESAREIRVRRHFSPWLDTVRT